MRLKFFFRNVLLLFPTVYQIYQDKTLSQLRRIIYPYYEKEFRKLPKLVGKKWNPSVILDIGGNLGQSSLAMDKLFDSEQLIVFEPNPPMAKQCRRLALRNIRQLEVHQVGLAKKEMYIDLYTPQYNGVTFWGLASLNKAQASSLIGIENVWRFDLDKLKVNHVQVELRTLDSYKYKPDFIKIDVEGFELDVIDGGIETIMSYKPLILVECSGTHSEVQRRLLPLGYKNFELKSGRWVPSQSHNLNQIYIFDRAAV